MIEKMRILLIEDNPGDVRMLREYLAEAADFKFDLVYAGLLSTALSILEEKDSNGVERFDIILSDLNLPDSQAHETINKLLLKTISPIIVLTGLDDEELALKLVQEGAQDYLIKGKVTSSLLVRSMRYAIERQRAEAALSQRARELEALYETSLEISGQLELHTLLHAIVERAARLVGVNMGGLYLVSLDHK
jgi:DNA-binding response OmpR family regulator